MATQIISLSLPAELLVVINEAAKATYCTRSDYIREAVVQKLNQQRLYDLRLLKQIELLQKPSNAPAVSTPRETKWV